MIIKEAVLNKFQMRDAISLAQELLYNPQEIQNIITDVTGSEYGSIEDLDVDEVYDQVRQYVISLLSDEDSNITNNDREDLIDAFDIQVRVTYEDTVRKSTESVVTEGIDDYEIYTLSMDIAIPKGSESKLRHDIDPVGKLYRELSDSLRVCGYEMAGDFIDYEEGNTEVYVDNEYEFFED